MREAMQTGGPGWAVRTHTVQVEKLRLQVGHRGARGLTLGIWLGLRDLPSGRHVLDHPRLRGPVLLRLRQRVPLHVLQVSPPEPPSRTRALQELAQDQEGAELWASATHRF